MDQESKATEAESGSLRNLSSNVTLPTGEDLDLASGAITSEEEDLIIKLPEGEEDENKLDTKDEIPITDLLNEMDGDYSDEENPDVGTATTSVTILPATNLDPNTVDEAASQTRPVNDVRLQQALDGQEPTVRNLIIAAIGVMKSRKARPDTKRICNWIHRRYGISYACISEELEQLVITGELARVDYKGSVSYRINSSTGGGKIAKRKKKPPKKPCESPNSTASSAPAIMTNVGPANNTKNGTTGHSPQPYSSKQHQDVSAYPVTLFTLINDMISNTPTDQGVTINTQFITKAIQHSNRAIDKPYLLSNLETVIKREIESGNLQKSGLDTFTVPSQGSVGISQQQQQQPQQVYCTVSKKTPSKSEEERKNDLIQERISKLTSSSSKDKDLKPKSPHKKVNSPNTKEPFYVTLREKRMAIINRKKLLNEQNSGSNNSITDEEVSKEMIEEALAENGTKLKGRAKRLKVQAQLKEFDKMKREGMSLHEMQAAILANIRANNSSSTNLKNAKKAKKQLQQREEWQTEQIQRPSADNEATLSSGRPGSKREKKSRKIFDPADHEPPSRKRKISSVSPTPPISGQSVLAKETNMIASQPSKAGESALGTKLPNDVTSFTSPWSPSMLTTMSKDLDMCFYCKIPSGKVGGDGKPEVLLTCRDCNTLVHPSCMDYTAELTEKILSCTDWQCTNCKTCAMCQSANPAEDEQMLFCDACDLGYHMSCHKPPVHAKPQGRWECFKCIPLQAFVASNNTHGTKGRSSARKQSLENSSSNRDHHHHHMHNGYHESSYQDSKSRLISRFIPLIGPLEYPHSGVLPKNWEQYPEDSNIPDIKEWKPNQVSTYFANLGFPDEIAGVFVKEEIDGRSVLLLQRQDVVKNLGIKMGPALKMFEQVKKLQTRRNFPPSY